MTDTPSLQPPQIKCIKKQLNDHFELVDLREINWLLGIHIQHDPTSHTISLSQQAYIDHIVDRIGLGDTRPIATPLEPGIDLSFDSPAISPECLNRSEILHYREAIGSLMYAAISTRPDISFAVSTLSHFMEAPRSTHWKAILQVFKYLKGTRELRLVLGGNETTLRGYSDADWASHADRYSISGYAFFIGDGAVSWSSKKQPIVTLLSTESEYVALTHSAKEVIWLRKLISELLDHLSSPSKLNCDNQGAITLSKDSTYHMHTKHIDTRFHFIHQLVTLCFTTLVYCSTEDMVADIFTKSLARVKLVKFRDLLGLSSPVSA